MYQFLTTYQSELPVFGSDISNKALDATKHNIEPFGFPSNLLNERLFLGDFDDVEKRIPTDKDVMVITSISSSPHLLISSSISFPF
jgi:methylase of polypeptide subunit release factors